MSSSRISLLILLVLAAWCGSPAAERMATVEGNCFLEGATNHEGTKILFEAISPAAQTDSIYTDPLGYYLIGLSEGEYAVHCSHDGYVPYTFPETYLFTETGMVLEDVTLQEGQVIEVEGNVNGEWTSDYVYFIIGEITVQAGDTLIVHEGTEIRFQGAFGLTVYGGFFAMGTVEEPVVLTSGQPDPGGGDWTGIVGDDDAPSFGFALQNCVIEYADDGIELSSSVTAPTWQLSGCEIRYCARDGIRGLRGIDADGCRIHHNGQSGARGSYSRFADCEVYDNYSGGLSLDSGSEVLDCLLVSNGPGTWNLGTEISIHGNDIVARGNLILADAAHAGINMMGAGDTLRAQRNVIVGVDDYGVYARVEDGHLLIENNVIAGSGDHGLWLTLEDGGGVEVRNNILHENENGIAWGVVNASVTHNDILSLEQNHTGNNVPTGMGEMSLINANGDSCDVYYNISLDPEFVAEDDFHLLPTSPCIDAGDPDPAYYDPDGSIADMGVYPYYHETPDPCSVDFMASPLEGNSPLPVQFIATNTGGPVTSWQWNFGDGCVSSRPHPVHTYSSLMGETFSVSLVAEGPGGQCAISYPDLITVNPADLSPNADFVGEPLVGFGEVVFTNLSMGAIESYEWDFGDGLGTSDEENPVYMYAPVEETSTYTVSLTVNGPNGPDTESKEHYITILPPETVVAAFAPSDTFGVVPAAIAFDNQSLGTITDWEWDFGDGGTSSLEEPVHEYLESGDYQVRLVAIGPAESDTAFATIRIRDPEPVIQSITDVPDDQGGQVYLRFTRSGYDTETPRSELYTVQRKDLDQWVTLFAGGAYGQDQYVYLAPTLHDSSAVDDGLTHFRILASMDEGIYMSAPDSGYSVDNIAPGPPGGFYAVYSSGGNQLSWDAASEEDFQFFRVYRSLEPGFEPSPEHIVHETAEASWIDTEIGEEWASAHYLLSILDDAGNEGPAVPPETFSDAEERAWENRWALLRPAPNPVNPVTQIAFDVPASGGDVYLAIYDSNGRRVRVLAEGHQDGGRVIRVWNGKDDRGRPLPSGLYLCRLESRDTALSRKIQLLR